MSIMIKQRTMPALIFKNLLHTNKNVMNEHVKSRLQCDIECFKSNSDYYLGQAEGRRDFLKLSQTATREQRERAVAEVQMYHELHKHYQALAANTQFILNTFDNGGIDA